MCYGWYEYFKCMVCAGTYGKRYNVRKCALENSEKLCSRQAGRGARLPVTKIEDDIKLDWACKTCKGKLEADRASRADQTSSGVKPLLWNHEHNKWSNTW